MRRLAYKKRGSLACLRSLLGLPWNAPPREIATAIERAAYEDSVGVEAALFSVTGTRDRSAALSILRADGRHVPPLDAA